MTELLRMLVGGIVRFPGRAWQWYRETRVTYLENETMTRLTGSLPQYRGRMDGRE